MAVEESSPEARVMLLLQEEPKISTFMKNVFSHHASKGMSMTDLHQQTRALLLAVNSTVPADPSPQQDSETGMDYIERLSSQRALQNTHKLLERKELKPTKSCGVTYFKTIFPQARQAAQSSYQASHSPSEDQLVAFETLCDWLDLQLNDQEAAIFAVDYLQRIHAQAAERKRSRNEGTYE